MALKTPAKSPMPRPISVRVRLSLRYFWSPRILLRILIVDHPAVAPHRLSRRLNQPAQAP